MSDFVDFKSLIPRALEKFRLGREARASLVCERFRLIAPVIVGQGCEELIHPKFVKNGVLYISVPSSIWAQKVFVKRHMLMEELNREKEIVKDLKVQVE